MTTIVTVTTMGPVVQEVIRYAVTMSEEAMDTVGIRDAKSGLSDLVNRVIYRAETIWITKNNRRVAALVPIEVAEAGLKALGRDNAASDSR